MKLDKIDRWRFLIFFSIILLLISPFSFFETSKALESLQSNRISSGVLQDYPECPYGHRQKPSCKVRIIETDSVEIISIPAALCEYLQTGDTISLKYSNDFQYYIDDPGYQEQQKQGYDLSIACFIAGFLIFLYCFFKIIKNKNIESK